MSAAALLNRLPSAKKIRDGIYSAQCPAHEDDSPSLRISEHSKTGAVLVKCFAGCTFEEIISAVGIEAHELFPQRIDGDFIKGERRPWIAADVLRAIVDELGVIAIIAGDLEHGRPVAKTDFDRLRLARQRIEAARELALGQA
jgi:hypothetical protein